MATERTFSEINCAKLDVDVAADELCEALVVKIETDLGDGTDLLPEVRLQADQIISAIIENLMQYHDSDA